MLTYQVRPRIFRLTSGKEPTFPALAEICFHFQPPQPFGAAAGGGRTAVRGVGGLAFFNANSGESNIESAEPLSPLDVTIEEPARMLRLAGTTLSISQQFQSLKEGSGSTIGT